MGVYIKGMEMPTSCRACLYSRTDIRNLDWCVLTEKDLPCDCPLVPVPPHGRLGDLDAFVKRISELVRKAETDGFDLGVVWYTAFIRHIELAPTIIPAEGGDAE